MRHAASREPPVAHQPLACFFLDVCGRDARSGGGWGLRMATPIPTGEIVWECCDGWWLSAEWWRDMATYMVCRGYSTFREWHRDTFGGEYPLTDTRCFAKRTGLRVGRYRRGNARGWAYANVGLSGAQLLRHWHTHDPDSTWWRRRGSASLLLVLHPPALHASRCCYGLYFDMYARSSPPHDTWFFDPDMPLLHQSSQVGKDMHQVVVENCHAWFGDRDIASLDEHIQRAHSAWRRRGGVMHNHRRRAAWVYAALTRHRRSFLTLLRAWQKRRDDVHRLRAVSPRHETRGVSHTEIAARLRGHPSMGMRCVMALET